MIIFELKQKLKMW